MKGSEYLKGKKKSCEQTWTGELDQEFSCFEVGETHSMVRHEDKLQDDDETNEQRLLVHEAKRVVEQRLTVQESEDREQEEQIHLENNK